MVAPLSARISKIGRNLLPALFWTVGGISALVLAQRFLSGDTLEQQRQDDKELKQRQAVAQSTQISPAAIAAMLDNQRDAGQKGAPAADARAQPGGAITPGIAAGHAPAAPRSVGPAPPTANPAAASARQGSSDTPTLRLPQGSPPSAGAPAFDDGDIGNGGGSSMQRARAQARASEIALYEDAGDPRPAEPKANPANALIDRLTGPAASNITQANQVLADYVKTQAALGAGRATAAGAARSGNDEWLAAQAQSKQGDDQPLRPTAAPSSQYMLFEGTPVRIALAQDLNSELAGDFSAMVTRDVYDSVSGRHLLIPWGSKVRCKYNSEVAAGQRRMLFACHRMIWPLGASIRLPGMPGSDTAGASGAEAKADNHFWQIFGSSLAVGAAALFAERAGGGSSNVTINLGGTGNGGAAPLASQVLSDVVKQMLSRNQNIKPTLSLSQGEELTLVINRDMDLPPSVTGVQQPN